MSIPLAKLSLKTQAPMWPTLVTNRSRLRWDHLFWEIVYHKIVRMGILWCVCPSYTYSQKERK